MRGSRILKTFWAGSVISMAGCFITITFYKEFALSINLENPKLLFLTLFTISFFAEYVDSSLGMGYGTILSPLLLFMGFSPLSFVPAILFSEFFSGVSSGFFHLKAGNLDLGRGTRSRKTVIVLLIFSIIGTFGAVFLAFSLPERVVKLYIGVMISAMGLFILLGKRFFGGFSWSKIISLGTLAAFNKGISGGGYGPLVTGGQILGGMPEKNAVGITSLVEGIVCLFGLSFYLFAGGGLYWLLTAALTLGAFLSTPAAAWTVKSLPGGVLRRTIGYATFLLGVLTLFMLF